MRWLKNIFLIFLIIFFSSSLIRNVVNYQNRIAFLKRFKSEVEKEKKKKLTLQTEILKKSDFYELEKTIRNKLNLARPDEVAIILPPPTPTPTIITPTPLPNWQQWWQLFFMQS
ncbi:hypothetical protein COS31_04725 [Candidatus Roizmanbacteria bacterium CG02_land_8_20_14_3_00_36_15]|uniref:Septum formation initiator n=2 Tax=Candidatus Roizmaniibacteriota TaxID=1752723 RepID=A0A2M8KK97_9BACT|nr:MAG: hypothetical protein COS51_01975 [Candidatus Roizmanbacteria bacterium CG03_land_8_20_14_0_80_36_21]PIV37470.1 MAG: hypothetical protein COS31_04725 [Candidatus Roizmanbacteria bacterium CG02_land_8_20_14_3_00_36_15]PIY70546.1 MAG: hypothetical protein COY89_00780 [Candidatus Roizmanbacteria bacterium CG_4_10_14_0_8_um_filter_36_36]PJA52655.1 MAG: hypothetical protein CO166_05065 [Candidatus Roizmanbacteria bacterium CG_4_9_14_3_um_filter_36_11]PJC81549.1 MAG: hypothetical protein CO007